jgi:hypothetical protein
MKFKAILIGVELDRPLSIFAQTKDSAERWGRSTLENLTPAERKTASVWIIEIREVVVGELR